MIDRLKWNVVCQECNPIPSCNKCANLRLCNHSAPSDYNCFTPRLVGNYCSSCGRPLSEEAWKLLEIKIQGEYHE